eukprot:m.60534 g.60534  ORF g.60534 m.60534 type:complete len:865 (+) comp11330_c0_seq2:42-2636(+)
MGAVIIAAALLSTAVSVKLPKFEYVDITLDAGGWVTGVVKHEATGRIMARTDVGGVYRLNMIGTDITKWEWEWMSGSIGLDGAWDTQSLIADNSDATGNTWFMAVGAPSDNVTKNSYQGAGVYKTVDYGNTWIRVLGAKEDVTFNGNGDERHGGEVIYTFSQTVWVASDNGLWRSDTNGEEGSFSYVSLPASIYNVSNGQGLGFVHASPMPDTGNIDKDEKSQIVWVGGDNTLAVSVNNGRTWQSVLNSGNISSLQITGAERIVPCANGTTIFVAARTLNSYKKERMTTVYNAEAKLTSAAQLYHSNHTTKKLFDLVQSHRRAERRSLRKRRLIFRGDEWQGKQPSYDTIAVKLTLTLNGTGLEQWDWAWTMVSPRTDGGLKKGSGGTDLITLMEDEHVLVIAYADNSFGVSRDGGWHFIMKNRTLVPSSAPGWYPEPSVRSTIPYGNGELVYVESVNGWLMGTGFLPAITMDEGDNWYAVTKGFAEVCTYKPLYTPAQSAQYHIMGGVMDLSMFAWTSSASASKGSYDYSFFAHQPGNVWWVTDYCHATVVTSSGDLLSFCNHQGWGCGQLVRSSDNGKTWTLTDSKDVKGISNCIPFVDVAQNPNNLDDIVITGAYGWMPQPGKSNATTWFGGVRRSSDGGLTWQYSDCDAVKGFVGSYWSPQNNLARDPLNPATVYLLTDVSSVSISEDSGATWSSCKSSPVKGAMNGVIAVWDRHKSSNGMSPVLVLGGENGPIGGSLHVSYDGCDSWSLLNNMSLFTWEYGMSGPILTAYGDTLVVWAAPGPQVKNLSTLIGSYYASIDAGFTWTEITPANISESTGTFPGPRHVTKPTGALIDPTNPHIIYIATGGRSYGLVNMAPAA